MCSALQRSSLGSLFSKLLCPHPWDLHAVWPYQAPVPAVVYSLAKVSPDEVETSSSLWEGWGGADCRPHRCHTATLPQVPVATSCIKQTNKLLSNTSKIALRVLIQKLSIEITIDLKGALGSSKRLQCNDLAIAHCRVTHAVHEVCFGEKGIIEIVFGYVP